MAHPDDGKANRKPGGQGGETIPETVVTPVSAVTAIRRLAASVGAGPGRVD